MVRDRKLVNSSLNDRDRQLRNCSVVLFSYCNTAFFISAIAAIYRCNQSNRIHCLFFTYFASGRMNAFHPWSKCLPRRQPQWSLLKISFLTFFPLPFFPLPFFFPDFRGSQAFASAWWLLSGSPVAISDISWKPSHARQRLFFLSQYMHFICWAWSRLQISPKGWTTWCWRYLYLYFRWYFLHPASCRCLHWQWSFVFLLPAVSSPAWFYSASLHILFWQPG